MVTQIDRQLCAEIKANTSAEHQTAYAALHPLVNQAFGIMDHRMKIRRLGASGVAGAWVLVGRQFLPMSSRNSPALLVCFA